VGSGEEQNGLQMTGLNLMDKTLAVQGARIAYSIWDVAGNSRTADAKYNLFPSLASS
jgi:Rab family, other